MNGRPTKRLQVIQNHREANCICLFNFQYSKYMYKLILGPLLNSNESFTLNCTNQQNCRVQILKERTSVSVQKETRVLSLNNNLSSQNTLN
jgi:hypothetical protein